MMWIVEDSWKVCWGRMGTGTASNILGITYYVNEPSTRVLCVFLQIGTSEEGGWMRDLQVCMR